MCWWPLLPRRLLCLWRFPFTFDGIGIPRPVGGTKYVLHLFSGQRRWGDVQFYFDGMVQQTPHPLAMLSIDVQNDPVAGNLMDPSALCIFWP